MAKFYQHYSFLRFPTLALLMVEALIQRAVTMSKTGSYYCLDLPVTNDSTKNLAANNTIEKIWLPQLQALLRGFIQGSLHL